MKFSEWFDLHKLKHLKAYRQLQLTGAWPEGFIPPYVTMDAQWQFHLLSQLADAYMGQILGHIYRCYACDKAVEEGEAVWVAPVSLEATTGDKGNPYHVQCAPAQEP